MANNNKSKIKLLYLLKILEEETDAEHGLTMAQIIERLDEYGIPAERKGIYRDLKNLRDFDLDIIKIPHAPVEYALVRKDFTLPELMLMIDAIESCKFLTVRQSNKLTTNLKLLASDHERAQLDRNIHVHGRIRSKSEGVFENIDVLHEAIRTNKKVSFKYYRYDHAGERVATHDGERYVVTPVGITFWDGNYYLTAWSDEHDGMTEYRVDRMGSLKVTSEKATKNAQIQSYSDNDEEYASFGRFDGRPVTVTLVVDGDKVEIIMDRFGESAQLKPQSNGTVKAVVKIKKSEQFFGWLAGLGGKVRISAPKALRQEYHDYLRSLIVE